MPPREIKNLWVSPGLASKLLTKQITVEEVREAVANAPDVRKGPKNRPGQTGRAYFIVGETDAGRQLKVLVRRFNGGFAFVITAWSLDKVLRNADRLGGMEFPQFRDDQEMAEWFETNDVDPADLEIAEDVVVARDVTVTVLGGLYLLDWSGAPQSSSAPTDAEERTQELSPATS